MTNLIYNSKQLGTFESKKKQDIYLDLMIPREIITKYLHLTTKNVLDCINM